jgi:hypothetical protein
MSRLTWILYLLGSALVFGSWLGIISPTVGWIGWLVATGIALASWMRRPKRHACATPHGATRTSEASTFTAEEVEAARREVHGDE